MVVLIIVILVIAISWEISVFVDQYMSGEQLDISAAKKCIGSDPRDCNDTFEGADTPIDLSGLEPVCLSGNPQDCNDSGDVFLFNE